MTKDDDQDDDQNDPIADYVEWTEHRYDPGYYLGGNLPPHLRKSSLGPSARRRAGLLIGVMALTGMFGTISTVLTPGFSSPWELAAMVATVGLTATAAVKMYRSGLVKRDS